MKNKKNNFVNKRLLNLNSKWFIANNTFQKNKDITVILPVIKLWYSKCYYVETGIYSPAIGVALSWLKWNYYFTIQKVY